MNKITDEIVDSLTQYEGEDVLTLYVPTHRYPAPPNVQEDQIRYKNLVRLGYEKWHADNDEVKRDIMRQLESKVDDWSFWQHTSESLAVFVSREGIQMYHLPVECEERVHVGNTYDVTPLLLLKEINQPFYIFTLAVHNSKLFKGDIYDLEPVDISFPSSPEEALNIDEMYSGSNTIRGREGTGGDSAPNSPHGQGDSNHAGQEERRKYFRIIDNIILKSSNIDHSLPILIAATDSEASDYRAISKIKNLVDTHIHGNYTMAGLKDLHILAWGMIREGIVYPMMREKIDTFQELVGVQKASDELDDIVSATKSERVDCLMLSMLDLTADSVSDNSDSTMLIRYFDTYDKDNILSLVRSVAKKGGSIIGIDRILMHDAAAVAGIYRY